MNCSSNVAIVGGGPAGMTAALLLARAGHRVSLFEADDQLGGLWASRLDADGFFRSDNSCKVYQSSYTSAPSLLRLIGTDWRAHFTPRYDLTSDWLRPFVSDSRWRDLAALAAGFVAHRLGRGRGHEVSVSEFMAGRGLSEPCQTWMRATALGGIAGTLRMTMWEFFHRIGCNVSEIFRGARGPLYWNTQPPSAPGGFLSFWIDALRAAGVALHTGSPVTALARWGARGAAITTTDGARHESDAVFLALPPPALGRLLDASTDDVAEGFGMPRVALGDFLRRSLYSHVGISWFFDRPLPSDLPLGGHNVRRGWYPILVQHDQYRAQLRPPAVSVVVGSVAVDTRFRHHRLGTAAGEHSLEALAAILWDDERQVDPTLPEPIETVIAGGSSATQIVGQGPLPIAMAGADVFLATNMHGRAPYFTASLESAIQAGAIAAEYFDSGVERLPMGSPNRLPWGAPDRPRSAPRPRSALVAETGAAD